MEAPSGNVPPASPPPGRWLNSRSAAVYETAGERNRALVTAQIKLPSWISPCAIVSQSFPSTSTSAVTAPGFPRTGVHLRRAAPSRIRYTWTELSQPYR